MNVLTRRIFLAELLAASVSSDAYPTKPAIGIQLWAVNTEMTGHPARTLQALRTIGYQEVEFAPVGKSTPAELRKLMDEANLACPSAHLDFLDGDTEQLFEQAHLLRAQYATSSLLRWGTGKLLSPVLEPKTRAMTLDDAKRTADLANAVGEKARRAGLRYVYHNHAFEFVDQGGGAVGYDLLLEQTDPDLVQFELDCGWVRVAGYDPVHYLQRFPGRFPMLHIKDFLPATRERTEASAGVLHPGAELAHGFINYEPIVAAGRAAGVKHYFTEQERPFTRMSQLEAARVNYQHMREIMDR